MSRAYLATGIGRALILSSAMAAPLLRAANVEPALLPLRVRWGPRSRMWCLTLMVAPPPHSRFRKTFRRRAMVAISMHLLTAMRPPHVLDVVDGVLNALLELTQFVIGVIGAADNGDKQQVISQRPWQTAPTSVHDYPWPQKQRKDHHGVCLCLSVCLAGWLAGSLPARAS